MGQGRENARLFLKEHADVREKIEKELRKKLGIPQPGSPNGNQAPAAQAEKPTAQAAAAGAAGKAGPPRR